MAFFFRPGMCRKNYFKFPTRNGETNTHIKKTLLPQSTNFASIFPPPTTACDCVFYAAGSQCDRLFLVFKKKMSIAWRRVVFAGPLNAVELERSPRTIKTKKNRKKTGKKTENKRMDGIGLQTNISFPLAQKERLATSINRDYFAATSSNLFPASEWWEFFSHEGGLKQTWLPAVLVILWFLVNGRKSQQFWVMGSAPEKPYNPFRTVPFVCFCYQRCWPKINGYPKTARLKPRSAIISEDKIISWAVTFQRQRRSYPEEFCCNFFFIISHGLERFSGLLHQTRHNNVHNLKEGFLPGKGYRRTVCVFPRNLLLLRRPRNSLLTFFKPQKACKYFRIPRSTMANNVLTDFWVLKIPTISMVYSGPKGK